MLRRRRMEADIRIARWLASSITEPDFAYEDWQRGRPAVLRVGVRFDAVKMHPNLVHAALGVTGVTDVVDAMPVMIGGPVVAHPGPWYHALVPVGTCARWGEPYGTMLGVGGWLKVPHPSNRGTSDVHWASPVVAPGQLCDPGDVAALLRAGAGKLGDNA
ncbi:hypothetical protein DVK44_29630 [Streptomyces paludis]|uniref:DNA primase/polymerase bifunctional N-terminal domain-containing protein n=2 Tax=Streptomyces paludis TaxID=2282738 RepID=A0A345HWU0_9ACTN|nr:hypothetical protein DVK44_29630 [Streptomyces paludis]